MNFESIQHQFDRLFDEHYQDYMREYMNQFVDIRNIGNDSSVFYIDDDIDYIDEAVHFKYPKPYDYTYEHKEIMHYSKEIDDFLHGFRISHSEEVFVHE